MKKMDVNIGLRAGSYGKLLDVKENETINILVVDDIAETRDGIEKLLSADGYCVAVARDEADAVERAQQKQPSLILVSLGGIPREVIAAARRIRQRARIREHVPVVLFFVEGFAEGEEVAIGSNVYITCPDNFNQLRSLLARLLKISCRAGPSAYCDSYH
jgi:pilus assembly protein CpaE